jgi:putative NIF3 family GTP cyclohydrolase 1 type 2
MSQPPLSTSLNSPQPAAPAADVPSTAPPAQPVSLQRFVAAMQRLAPTHLAEPWDNVGLLVGESAHVVRHVLCCIDYTEAVAQEATERLCDTVVAYHPPLFKPLKRLRPGCLLADAARRNRAIYSPHTAYDVVAGGVNDVLADAVGLHSGTRRLALRPSSTAAQALKLVFFAPIADCERICAALFAAGAGQLGQYSECSFQTRGVGRFRGGPDSRPAVGRPQRLEKVEENRVEVVVPSACQTAVVEALLQAHPYEEPAYDLFALQSLPGYAHRALGLGRVADLEEPQTLRSLVEKLKLACGVGHLLQALPTAWAGANPSAPWETPVGPAHWDGADAAPTGAPTPHSQVAGGQPPDSTTVQRVAVCAGAGGDLIEEVLSSGAQVFITGELRHHDALRLAANGVAALCVQHSNSERLALKVLEKQLLAQLPELQVSLSERDQDPFLVV